MSGMTFSVRATGDPLALGPGLRELVRGIDSNLPITDMQTQSARAGETLAEERMYARLIGLFGGLALLLAAIGIYGVMAYSVTQRTSEIGIRMALGARTTHVLSLILRQALALSAVGVVVGVMSAVALRRFIAARLYGVEASDPATFAAMSGLLLLTALVACAVPASRASRVEPLKALRCE